MSFTISLRINVFICQIGFHRFGDTSTYYTLILIHFKEDIITIFEGFLKIKKMRGLSVYNAPFIANEVEVM
jgi:hypothetical protein